MAEWPDDVENDTYEQLDAQDTLDVVGPADFMNEGYSPPERPQALGMWGTTAAEAADREGLEGRLAREMPDIEPYLWDGLGDTSDTDGELIDDEVGDARSGRLAPVDEDPLSGWSGEMVARDVGLDGSGASAEEAAVHVIPEPGDSWR